MLSRSISLLTTFLKINDGSHIIFLFPFTQRQYKTYYRTNSSIIFTRYTMNKLTSDPVNAVRHSTQVSYTISYFSTYKTTSDENLTRLSLSTNTTSSTWNVHHSKQQERLTFYENTSKSLYHLSYQNCITIVLWPLFGDHPAEPVPEENFWTLVQGKINIGKDTDHLAGSHSIQTNQCPPPPSPSLFYTLDALPPAQPTVSKHWRQLAHSD